MQPPPEGFESWDAFAKEVGIPEEKWNDVSAVVDPDGRRAPGFSSSDTTAANPIRECTSTSIPSAAREWAQPIEDDERGGDWLESAPGS